MSLFLLSNQKISSALTIPFLCQYKLIKLYELFELSLNNTKYSPTLQQLGLGPNPLWVQIENRVPLCRRSCRNIVFSGD